MISLLTELAVVLVLRTRKPVFRSRPSRLLVWSTLAVVTATFAIPFLGGTSSAFDQVTAIAIGDLHRGYTPIDMSGAEKQIYGVSAPLFFALLIVAIPKFTKGKLKLTAKDSAGKPLTSRVAAVAVPIRATPDLLPEAGTVIEARGIAARSTGGAALEIKEWQAIMQPLQSMPVTAGDTLPTVPTDGPAREIRFTRLGG